MAGTIPIVDIAAFGNGSSAQRLAVARAVDKACTEIGFLLDWHGQPGDAGEPLHRLGKEIPSVSIRKAKPSPCLPDEKSWKNPFWSLTKKEGLFSALNGDSPAHSRPCFRSLTFFLTTSDTGTRARISSRKEGGNFMAGLFSRSLHDHATSID